jgi:hypothetical protein
MSDSNTIDYLLKRMTLRGLFQRLLQGRYVGMLEGEVARLRAENRALTNSLLGTAGFPPVDYPEPAKPQPVPRLRKRSWHQIQAWKEAEAGSNEIVK